MPLRHCCLLLTTLLLPGCYLLHTAQGQWSVMAKRQPITEVISEPQTAAPVRTQLQNVLAIRDFAVRELALPDNGSYRSYADLDRPYVVWNVVAAAEFSVQPKRWCFPIAGCVAYRGYFSEAKARKFATRLQGQGYDTSVGGVAAYSTLGHFDDPVLNTMLGWSDVQLAAIIFHELSHQLLYVPDDSSFNEGFASVVEGEGVRRWLLSQGRERDLELYREQRRRYAEFVALLDRTRAQLRTLYRSKLDANAMRTRKREVFEQLAVEHSRLKARWGGRSAFDRWFTEGVNNAHLVSVATYEQCVPGIQAVLAATGNDLSEFYARLRAIAALDPAAREQRVCRVPVTASPAPLTTQDSGN